MRLDPRAEAAPEARRVMRYRREPRRVKPVGLAVSGAGPRARDFPV